MLLEEHAKEDLSRAYVLAVGAKAGAMVTLNDRSHDYGIDGSFHQITRGKGRRIEPGHVLDFQLKATARAVFKNDYVCFHLIQNLIIFCRNVQDIHIPHQLF